MSVHDHEYVRLVIRDISVLKQETVWRGDCDVVGKGIPFHDLLVPLKILPIFGFFEQNKVLGVGLKPFDSFGNSLIPRLVILESQ